MKRNYIILLILVLCYLFKVWEYFYLGDSQKISAFNLLNQQEQVINLPSENISTINQDLQKIVEKELQNVLEKTKSLRGAIIVENVNNGEIIALTTKTYDKDIKEGQFENWVLTDSFYQDSFFDPINVITALDLEKLDKNSKISDTGKIKVGIAWLVNRDYSKNRYPGLVDISYLLKNESNVGMVKIGNKISAEEYNEKFENFGFNEKTGLGLMDVKQDTIKKKIKEKNKYYVSIGYGIHTTPLQLLNFYSALANNGNYIEPHVLKNVDAQRKQSMQGKNAEIVYEILRKNSNENTKLNNIALKTSTILMSKKDIIKKSRRDFRCLSIGYLKSKDSNFITYVLIQSPKTNKVLSCKLIESTNKKILKSIEYANGIVDIKKMAHYLYQLGIEDKENNELYSNAIENYSAAIELDPQNSAFYFARGLAYDSIKEPKAAIEDFNKAIELNPKNAGAYMYRGVLKHLYGNDSDALKDINIAMKYSSLARGSLYLARADIKLNLKDYIGAISDYKSARNYIEKNTAVDLNGCKKTLEYIDNQLKNLSNKHLQD